MSQQIVDAAKKFSAHGGILRTSQVLALGVSPRTLYAMRDLGLIRSLGRGVYQLSSEEPLGNPDLISVSLRVPKAVVCLISALHFYGMTDHIPHRVYIALPQPAEKPRIEYPPLDIIWLSDNVYSSGIQEHPVDGFPVKVYSKEKTIADCFKFRNKIGASLALDALKKYIAQADRSIDTLLEYARMDRVEKLISPYLEALL